MSWISLGLLWLSCQSMPLMATTDSASPGLERQLEGVDARHGVVSSRGCLLFYTCTGIAADGAANQAAQQHRSCASCCLLTHSMAETYMGCMPLLPTFRILTGKKARTEGLLGTRRDGHKDRTLWRSAQDTFCSVRRYSLKLSSINHESTAGTPLTLCELVWTRAFRWITLTCIRGEGTGVSKNPLAAP